MNVQQTTKNKGFTIIEVVLVLAIAGLIFLMVFIALPALQRNQRDTARKNDVSTVASAYTTYTNNNRGNVPANATLTLPDTGKFGKYLDDLSDNSTTVIVRDYASGIKLSPSEGQIIITKKSKCAGEDALSDGTNRQFTVGTLLEGGNAIFCQDS